MSPYENILNAIPKEELEVILRGMGYVKVGIPKTDKPKKISEENKWIEYYSEKLKTKLFKNQKSPALTEL